MFEHGHEHETDAFAKSEMKRQKWDDVEEDDENEDTNLFQVFYRAALQDHAFSCSENACETCSIDPQSTYSYNESFRYGALAEKFGSKTLREIVAQLGWRTNPMESTVIPSSSTTESSNNRRELSPAISRLRKKLEAEAKIRKNRTNVEICGNNDISQSTSTPVKDPDTMDQMTIVD